MTQHLSAKQRAFVEHYLQCWAAGEAARRAGYGAPGSRVRGHQLLARPDVQAAIQERLADLKIGTDEVLVRLSEQARGAHAEYLLPNGSVDFGRLIADGKGHLVKGLRPTRWGLAVEFYDAQAALVQLGKVHGLLRDRLEIAGANGEPLRIVVEYADDPAATTEAA